MPCKVIAHRGSNKKAPQNTLASFKQAIEENTDGFETDVHLTKDGIPVICHNYSVDETSDSTGKVSSYTLSELKLLDFGSYFSEDFKGTQLPTLDEFLELVSSSDAEIINIELKCPSEGMHALVYKTIEAVKNYGVLDRVIISSFSPKILKICKQTDPRCKTAFLYPTNKPSICRPVFANPFIIAKNTGADYIHPAVFTVNYSTVAIAHKLGLKVNVWTVNDELTVKRLLSFGVDGIITDCPGKVKDIITKSKKKIRFPVISEQNRFESATKACSI